MRAADRFLSLAEESELIVQIGDWVLHAACAQAAAWRRDGIEMTVSVNISARELTGADLAARVQEALQYFRLPGHALCLDVSEAAILRDPARARSALKDVRRLGVAIALDNFGADHSSLSLPGSLPLNMLKLDRTLIQGFDRDKDRRAMVVAMLALAREGKLTAVAVGIETNRQLVLARELELRAGTGLPPIRPDAPERLAPQRGARGDTLAPTMAPDRATARRSRHHSRVSDVSRATDASWSSDARESRMSAIERHKRTAAQAAAALVKEGMRVGLGTGSTVAYLLPALAASEPAAACAAWRLRPRQSKRRGRWGWRWRTWMGSVGSTSRSTALIRSTHAGGW